MRSRTTVTAALALAAVTILAVAACGSSVTGSAQANSAAAETMVAPTTAASIPSELTEQTALPTDLAELTSMLNELPTDFSVPSELTDISLPSDLSIPSDLSDLTNLDIPGYNEDCLSVASAYASISLALLPVLFGGTDQFDTTDLETTLNSLSGSVPPELQGDIQTLSNLAAQASGKTLTEAAALFESDEYTTASDNIDAWITANCG